MTYPTYPALNSSQAEYPELWDGLVFAYLPGYDKDAPIVGGGTMGGSTTTTIDSYTEGLGETLDLTEYRTSTATPLEGTTAATIHGYWRMLWTNDCVGSGVIGTAASTTWQNVGELLLNDISGTCRGVWRKGGSEAYVSSPFAVHNATTNPVVNAVSWRDASAVGIHDFIVASATASATSIAGAMTSTEPVIIGSYYDKSSERSSNIAFFCGAVWNRVLTTDERALLNTDPYAVFRKSAGGATTHDTTGALASQTSMVSGASTRTGNHATTGALAATAATIAGASARSGSFITHGTSGDLSAASASVAASSVRASASVTHATTGSASAAPASVSALASRSVAGQITTDILVNNTMTPLANTSVVWSWLPIGRIGSLSAITPVDGTGTTGSDGRLTVSGLTAGAGILLVAKQNSGATDDDVFYQAGTVA